MTVDLFGAFERYFGGSKNNAQFEDGVIQSIIGNTALVRVSGSDRVQECYYSKGSNLEPGDRCILMRTSRNARWTVVSGFSTSYGGNNPESSNPEPEPSVPSSSATSGYAAGGGNSSSGLGRQTSFTTIFSVTITTVLPLSHILVSFSGDSYFASNYTGRQLEIRLRHGSETLVDQTDITAGQFYRLPITLVGVKTSVTPGSYTFNIEARSSSDSGNSNNLYVFKNAFLALEIPATMMVFG